MHPYTIREIAEKLKAPFIGDQERLIRYISIDSRTIQSPSSTLFFAIRGERHDGHSFVGDLYDAGIRSFVVESIPAKYSFSDASFIKVSDTLAALQALASVHRALFTCPVIGITGSNGKTIVKEWLYQMLHGEKNIVRSPKSYNSQVGVPLSVWMMDETHELALFEAGISMPGEMQRLERIIQPTLGVITNIREPHQENFINLAQKCREKLLLFKNCEAVIYCADHVLVHEQLQSPDFSNVQKIAWSVTAETFVRVNRIQKKSNLTEIMGRCGTEEFAFQIPFIDNASVENALHVITVLFHLGYSSAFIAGRLAHLSPVAMRLELKAGINQCTIINDSYNSDLGSLAIALDFLVNQRQHKKRTVILSDILQSGQKSDSLYQEVSRLLLEKGVERFIGIGEEIAHHKALFGSSAEFYLTTGEFLQHIRTGQFGNEAILLKGSRKYAFEQILGVLEKKVHQTVLEINLNALIHNLNYFRSKLNPGTKLIVMVKAFSYGSGSYEIANVLQFHKVDYLAVAFADEGVALREAGITLPVIVMNPEKNSYEQIIKYRLEPEIYSFRELDDFSEALELQAEVDYPVHLKLDTGMHRLGFMPQEIGTLTDLLKKQTAVRVASIFSHLAGSDEEQFDSFTQEQIAVFEEQSSRIIQSLSYPVLRHILNSAGIERFSSAQYDMVRLGIGLYGISAVDQKNVRNISTLKTVILQVKEIPAEDTVGYSRKFKAKVPTRIGILPIGYADGLHRILGNGVGKLWVNGKFAPIIGNICMDMCMIDITETSAKEGDEVIIFGDNAPVTELARLMKTIPYEVFTSISPRVKRVYFQE